MSSLTENSRKWKLTHINRKKINGCLGKEFFWWFFFWREETIGLQWGLEGMDKFVILIMVIISWLYVKTHLNVHFKYVQLNLHLLNLNKPA